MTTSKPRPPVSAATPSAKSSAVGIERCSGADLQCLVAPCRLWLEQDDRGVVRGRSHDAKQSDRAAADDRHDICGIDAAGGDGRAVGDGERLDERTFCERELLGQLVKPVTSRLQILGVGAADGEAEVVSSAVSTTHSPTTESPALQRTHGRSGLGDLAGPLVAGDDRVRDGDDVPALVELEVRVADADVARAHEHFVGADLRVPDIGHDRFVWGLEDQRLHRSPRSVFIAAAWMTSFTWRSAPSSRRPRPS